MAAGFSIKGPFGIEWPARMSPEFDADWEAPEKRALMLEVAVRVESDSFIASIGPHLIAIGRKAG